MNRNVSTDLKTILQLRVPVIVQIARQRMPMDSILELGPGAILEFDKSADDELDLLVNNKPIGRGAAVKVGENFGLRLTAIGEPQQRVAAMTGQPTTSAEAAESAESAAPEKEPVSATASAETSAGESG